MTFQEIFNEKGLYTADGFAKGVCFEINDMGELILVTYENADDILPHKENALVYRGLFNKNYRKVYTRKSLFK